MAFFLPENYFLSYFRCLIFKETYITVSTPIGGLISQWLWDSPYDSLQPMAQ